MVETRQILQSLIRTKVQLGAAKNAKLPYEEDSFVRAGFYFLADSINAFLEQQRGVYNLSTESVALRSYLFDSGSALQGGLEELLPPVLISLQNEQWFVEFCQLWRGQLGAVWSGGGAVTGNPVNVGYHSAINKTESNMLISSSGVLKLDIKSLSIVYEGASAFVERQRALDAEY